MKKNVENIYRLTWLFITGFIRFCPPFYICAVKSLAQNKAN